ncbi:Retrotransposon gag protein [Corchorus capsularis]|uniref:Retrotransposon gag protein n=1 Tax=Corchorus capsularis TaxID=210143 RepID=A0A1R3FV46_COCAP|nr:Retrotransposon gag protein [Corchorus capsularis]
MAFSLCTVRVHYQGRFEWQGPRLRYVDGLVNDIRIDLDKLSYSQIKEVLEDNGYKNVQNIYYLRLGFRLEKGLRRVFSDDSAMGMISDALSRNFVEIFIEHSVQEGPEIFLALPPPDNNANDEDHDELHVEMNNEGNDGGGVQDQGVGPSLPLISFPEDSNHQKISMASLEEQVASLAKAVESLANNIKEKDEQISFLMMKVVENKGKDKPQILQQVDETTAENSNNKNVQEFGENSTKVAAEDLQSISSDQIKELIKEAIKDQAENIAPLSYTYAKSYSQRIDCMKMPDNYQPSKFQQFDGKGNPRQPVAHFVETCNNAGTYGDLMVKQFVRSLKGNAFDWYTDLEPGSIDNWEQLEHEFLNRFYSTRHIVSLIELTSVTM